MLSDDSSSDSETGRFKDSSGKKESEHKSSSHQRGDRFKSSHGNDRHRRELDIREDRSRFGRRSPERSRFSRHSPRRRHSKERSADRRRRSPERPRHERTPHRGNRSASKEKHTQSKVRSRRSPEQKRDLLDEIRRNITTDTKNRSSRHDRSSSVDKKSAEKRKKSEVHRPSPTAARHKHKSNSPIVIHDDQPEDENPKKADQPESQPASYYSLVTAVKEESVEEEESVTDSSDDERLRAKLLNLEKELDKTRKKKHKKKHKKKSSKSKTKDKDREGSNSVEVSSTTDIKDIVKSNDVIIIENDTPEISSTQKVTKKETSEEGEITSEDDDSQKLHQDNIDPNDLRHKLKRSVANEPSTSPDLRDRLQSRGDVCGPALPPRLENRLMRSPAMEGPALPPHLEHKERHIGPSIPKEMRKVLAEAERPVTYESSDEDVGIGPLPTGLENKWTDAHQKLEERALGMKIRNLDGHSLHASDKKSREEWMLELPEAKAQYLGVEARKFRAKEGPDMSDRSSWTDTPEQKARKAAGEPAQEDSRVVLEREARAKCISDRDADQEHVARKHKKKHKRDESLLDMHQKKLKKKKKKEEKEEGKQERRPFSRDVDLQVNRFDDAQKKSIIKKAQHLDSRFSRGEAKYL